MFEEIIHPNQMISDWWSVGHWRVAWDPHRMSLNSSLLKGWNPLDVGLLGNQQETTHFGGPPIGDGCVVFAPRFAVTWSHSSEMAQVMGIRLVPQIFKVFPYGYMCLFFGCRDATESISVTAPAKVPTPVAFEALRSLSETGFPELNKWACVATCSKLGIRTTVNGCLRKGSLHGSGRPCPNFY